MVRPLKKVTLHIEMPKQLHEIIIDIVCEYYGIDRKSLFKKERSRKVSDRRFVLFYLLHKGMGRQPYEIAQILNIKKGSVEYGVPYVENELNMYGNRFKYDVKTLEKIIEETLSPLREWTTL